MSSVNFSPSSVPVRKDRDLPNLPGSLQHLQEYHSDSDDTFFVPKRCTGRRKLAVVATSSQPSPSYVTVSDVQPSSSSAGNMVLISTTSMYTGDEFCDVSLENLSEIKGVYDNEDPRGLSANDRISKTYLKNLTSKFKHRRSSFANSNVFHKVDLTPRGEPEGQDQEVTSLPTFDVHGDRESPSFPRKRNSSGPKAAPKDFSAFEPGTQNLSLWPTNVHFNHALESPPYSSSPPRNNASSFAHIPLTTYDTTCDESDAMTIIDNYYKRNELNTRTRKSSLVDGLLLSIYRQDRRCSSVGAESDTLTEHSTTSDTPYCNQGALGHRPAFGGQTRSGITHRKSKLLNKCPSELRHLIKSQQTELSGKCAMLIKELKKKDRLRQRRDQQNDLVTAILHALSQKRSQDTRIRFSVAPLPGDSTFVQWHDAMMMCARLPGGIPQEFRRRLWLTLSEKHLQARGVDWSHAQRFCFNEWSNPDDDELGDQIVKDLHRTGCSLFCGEEAEDNQAMLKRVLLAYARWNKGVGYCQGFNMLAAIILEVMERHESDALKVMIYLIEGVLPESYFANNLRGLSVDMAVFRDLLRLRLPHLSRHLEHLQHDAADLATGTSYEPPLTNVFTMQWFLTLFSNCLPRETVMRVWDLTFLHGNEVLLRTALAIWDGLAVRILEVHSADEFYTVMGILTREMLTPGALDANTLVQTVVGMAPFPFPSLADLRDKYTYNITPWTQSVSSVAKRGLRLFYSDDDEDDNDEDDQKIAVATAFGLSGIFKKSIESSRGPSPVSGGTAVSPSAFSPLGIPTPRHGLEPPREISRPNLDISALKKQYARLRERQKQAHIILTSASQLRVGGGSGIGGQKSTPLTMNHLLRGKKALTSKTRRVVPQGVIPVIKPKKKAERKLSDTTGTRSTPQPSRSKQSLIPSSASGHAPHQTFKRLHNGSGGTPKIIETLHWKDTPRRDRRASLPSGVKLLEGPTFTSGTLGVPDEIEDDDGSSTSTELCDDDDEDKLSDLEPDAGSEQRPATTSPRLETVVEKAKDTPPKETPALQKPEAPSEEKSKEVPASEALSEKGPVAEEIKPTEAIASSEDITKKPTVKEVPDIDTTDTSLSVREIETTEASLAGTEIETTDASLAVTEIETTDASLAVTEIETTDASLAVTEIETTDTSLAVTEIETTDASLAVTEIEMTDTSLPVTETKTTDTGTSLEVTEIETTDNSVVVTEIETTDSSLAVTEMEATDTSLVEKEIETTNTSLTVTEIKTTDTSMAVIEKDTTDSSLAVTKIETTDTSLVMTEIEDTDSSLIQELQETLEAPSSAPISKEPFMWSFQPTSLAVTEIETTDTSLLQELQEATEGPLSAPVSQEAPLWSFQPSLETQTSFGIPLEDLLAGKSLTAAEIIARIPFPSDVSFMKEETESVKTNLALSDTNPDPFSTLHNVTPEKSPVDSPIPRFPSPITEKESSLVVGRSPSTSPSRTPPSRSHSPSPSPRGSPHISPERTSKSPSLSPPLTVEQSSLPTWSLTKLPPISIPDPQTDVQYTPPRSPKITLEDEKSNIFEIHSGMPPRKLSVEEVKKVISPPENKNVVVDHSEDRFSSFVILDACNVSYPSSKETSPVNQAAVLITDEKEDEKNVMDATEVPSSPSHGKSTDNAITSVEQSITFNAALPVTSRFSSLISELQEKKVLENSENSDKSEPHDGKINVQDEDTDIAPVLSTALESPRATTPTVVDTESWLSLIKESTSVPAGEQPTTSSPSSSKNNVSNTDLSSSITTKSSYNFSVTSESVYCTASISETQPNDSSPAVTTPVTSVSPVKPSANEISIKNVPSTESDSAIISTEDTFVDNSVVLQEDANDSTRYTIPIVMKKEEIQTVASPVETVSTWANYLARVTEPQVGFIDKLQNEDVNESLNLIQKQEEIDSTDISVSIEERSLAFLERDKTSSISEKTETNILPKYLEKEETDSMSETSEALKSPLAKPIVTETTMTISSSTDLPGKETSPEASICISTYTILDSDEAVKVETSENLFAFLKDVTLVSSETTTDDVNINEILLSCKTKINETDASQGQSSDGIDEKLAAFKSRLFNGISETPTSDDTSEVYDLSPIETSKVVPPSKSETDLEKEINSLVDLKEVLLSYKTKMSTTEMVDMKDRSELFSTKTTIATTETVNPFSINEKETRLCYKTQTSLPEAFFQSSVDTKDTSELFSAKTTTSTTEAVSPSIDNKETRSWYKTQTSLPETAFHSSVGTKATSELFSSKTTIATTEAVNPSSIDSKEARSCYKTQISLPETFFHSSVDMRDTSESFSSKITKTITESVSPSSIDNKEIRLCYKTQTSLPEGVSCTTNDITEILSSYMTTSLTTKSASSLSPETNNTLLSSITASDTSEGISQSSTKISEVSSSKTSAFSSTLSEVKDISTVDTKSPLGSPVAGEKEALFSFKDRAENSKAVLQLSDDNHKTSDIKTITTDNITLSPTHSDLNPSILSYKTRPITTTVLSETGTHSPMYTDQAASIKSTLLGNLSSSLMSVSTTSKVATMEKEAEPAISHCKSLSPTLDMNGDTLNTSLRLSSTAAILREEEEEQFALRRIAEERMPSPLRNGKKSPSLDSSIERPSHVITPRDGESLSTSLEGRLSSLAATSLELDGYNVTGACGQEDKEAEKNPEESETDIFSGKDLSSEAIRQRLWRGVKSLSLDADVTLDPDVFCFLIQQCSRGGRRTDGGKTMKGKRRNSEVELQELVKENTEIIERILRQKSLDSSIYCIKESETPMMDSVDLPGDPSNKNRRSPSKIFGARIASSQSPSKNYLASLQLSKAVSSEICFGSKDRASDENESNSGAKSGKLSPQSSPRSSSSSEHRLSSESDISVKSCGITKSFTRPSKLSRSSSVTLDKTARPITFNPFPTRNINKPPKDVAVKLGLYSPKKSPGSSPT